MRLGPRTVLLPKPPFTSYAPSLNVVGCRAFVPSVEVANRIASPSWRGRELPLTRNCDFRGSVARARAAGVAPATTLRVRKCAQVNEVDAVLLMLT